MRYFYVCYIGIVLTMGYLGVFGNTAPVFGAPTQSARIERTILPETDSVYTLGTTTKAWLNVFTDELCLNGDCKVAWPSGGGGGGSGTVGTSTAPTNGHLAFWTSPSLLGSVATGTLSASSPLSLTGSTVIVGTSRTLSLDTSGTWSGNAGTATALAADGADCSAGSFPLGVSTLGAAQSCTDAWTEAENTSAAYAAQATTLTVNGTAQQITSSAGAQSLAANRTWTLSLPAHIVQSSALFTTSTTTNATSTNHAITSLLTFNGVTGSTWAAFCTTITGGSGLCDGTDATGSTVDPYGHLTNYGTTTSSTSTPAWFTTGMFASSTSRFVNASTTLVSGSNSYFTTASSTSLIVSGVRSALSLAGADGTVSAYGGAAACTNQFVTALSAVGGTTCASINNAHWSGTDLSVANGGTGLSTFGGTNHILYTTAADTLSSEAAFTYDPTPNVLTTTNASTTAISTSGTAYSATASTTNLTISSIKSAVVLTGSSGIAAAATTQTCTNQFVRALSAAYVATCATIAPADVDLTASWDFGAAAGFEIPNGTAPTVNATGELALDTTAGQLTFYDGLAQRSISATTTKSFNIASTSLDAMGKSFSVGTSTFLLQNDPRQLTMLGYYCVASSSAKAVAIDFGDGTNWTTMGACSGAYVRTTTNNTFTAFEDFIVRASSTATVTPINRITITAVFQETVQ